MVAPAPSARAPGVGHPPGSPDIKRRERPPSKRLQLTTVLMYVLINVLQSARYVKQCYANALYIGCQEKTEHPDKRSTNQRIILHPPASPMSLAKSGEMVVYEKAHDFDISV